MDVEGEAHSQGGVAAAERELASGNATPSHDGQRFEKSIMPLLKKACFECLSGDDAEGNFRADQLDPNVGSRDHLE